MKLQKALPIGLICFAGIVEAQTATSISLTVTPNSPQFGQQVTLQAQTTPAVIAGKVTFLDGVKLVGSATLSGGIATAKVTMPPGVHYLKAVYGGSAGMYLASQSAVQPY